MTAGWIKLHRQMMDCAALQDPFAVALWVHLLLRASTTKREVAFRGQIHVLERGQLATSYRQLAKDTRIGVQRIRTTIRNFVQCNMLKINTDTNTGCSQIFISNFNTFQVVEPAANTGVNTEPTQLQHTEQEREKGRRVRKKESETLSPTKESRATKPVARARSGNPPGYQSDFEEAWTAYPLRAEDKHDKAGCYRLWQTAQRTTDAGAITASAGAWSAEQAANPYRIGLRRWLKDKHYLHPPPVYRPGDGEHGDVIGDSQRQFVETIEEIRRRKAHGYEEFTGAHSSVPDGPSEDIWSGPEDDPGAFDEPKRALH